MNTKWLMLLGTGALSYLAACSSDGTGGPSNSAGATARAGASGAATAGGGGAPSAGAGGSLAGATAVAGAAGAIATAGAGGAGGNSAAGAGGVVGVAGASAGAAGASGGAGGAGGGACNTAPGKALKFDGNIVDLMSGDLGADFPGGDVPRTIELWAKFLGSQSWKAEGSMIETGHANGGDRVLGIDLSGYSGTTAEFGPYTNGFSDNNHPDGVMVPNTPQMGWLHLSFSYTGNHGTFSFTVNGMEYPIKTKTGTPTMNFTQGIVTLGASQSFGTQGWSGVMDEIKLWSVAKTPAEITANMRVVPKGTEPGLVAYYRFDEGSGDFSDDVSKKPSHRLSTCTATSTRCAAANAASPQWVDSDIPGTFTCAP